MPSVSLDFLGDLRRTHNGGELRASDAGKKALLMGWVHRRRDLGGVIFIHLRDREGVTQLVFHEDVDPALHAKAELLASEYVIAAEGTVSPRTAENVNPAIPTGEIELPVLTRSTPEGARDYLVPSRVNPGAFYALPQSPQIFKQLLMVSGFDKYFQIVRCFRDEDLRADRQPEFTQIDLEMSFPQQQTIFEVIEPLIARICKVAGFHIATPLPRLTYAEAMRNYGIDK